MFGEQMELDISQTDGVEMLVLGSQLVVRVKIKSWRSNLFWWRERDLNFGFRITLMCRAVIWKWFWEYVIKNYEKYQMKLGIWWGNSGKCKIDIIITFSAVGLIYGTIKVLNGTKLGIWGRDWVEILKCGMRVYTNVSVFGN